MLYSVFDVSLMHTLPILFFKLPHASISSVTLLGSGAVVTDATFTSLYRRMTPSIFTKSETSV